MAQATAVTARQRIECVMCEINNKFSTLNKLAPSMPTVLAHLKKTTSKVAPGKGEWTPAIM